MMISYRRVAVLVVDVGLLNTYSVPLCLLMLLVYSTSLFPVNWDLKAA